MRRESNAPIDWELPETSPSRLSEEQDPGHQSGNLNDDQREAIESPRLALPSSPPPPSQSLYYPELHHDNWPQHDMHQRLGFVRSSFHDDSLNLIPFSKMFV